MLTHTTQPIFALIYPSTSRRHVPTIVPLLLQHKQQQQQQVVGDSGLSPVGEVLLVPDLSAAVPCHAQDTLMAPVDMVEKDLSECSTEVV